MRNVLRSTIPFVLLTSLSGCFNAEITLTPNGKGGDYGSGGNGYSDPVLEVLSVPSLTPLRFWYLWGTTSSQALSGQYRLINRGPGSVSSIMVNTYVAMGGGSPPTLSPNLCSGANLAEGQSCDFTIAYTPQNSITSWAIVSFGYTLENNYFRNFSFNGFGYNNNLGNGIWDLSSYQNFWTATVGSSYNPIQKFDVVAGSSNYPITSISLSGANSSDFNLSASNCVTTLNANTGCTFTIQFKPQSAGFKNATLTLNASGSPASMTSTLYGYANSSSQTQTQTQAMISSISPTSGTSGTTVTITGSNLSSTSTTGVYIGINPCTSVNVVSSTTVTCIVPSGPAATSLPVRLATTDGQYTEYSMNGGWQYP